MKKLRFEETLHDKSVFYVLDDKDEHLGTIFSFYGWQKYVWKPRQNVIVDEDCLDEISGKLKELNKK
jgi:hypothetical protein